MIDEMDPEEISLRNTSHQFEYEKLSREIDNCDDVEALQQMCKFLVKLEMKTRETYSIMIEDLMTK
tara:strand:- start:3294 stop:3491 length:198 start_codon:yes stop_codon:yes gene_type:complete